MIPVEYYTTVYYILLCVILVIFLLPKLLAKSLEFNYTFTQKAFSFAILTICILFIGLRDPLGAFEYFGDTRAYTRTFEKIKYGYKTEFTKDIGFYVYMKLISSFASVKFFYLISAFIYVYLPYLTFKKWFRDYSIFVFIAYVASFSFLPFGINGLRNGLASAIFIFGLSFFDKKWFMFILFALSISFHKGMLLPLFAFFMSYFIQSPKKILLIWLLSIPISYTIGKNIESLALLVFGEDTFLQDERAQTYFSEESNIEKVAGQFRIDFIIYSAIAVFVGYWAIIKKGFNNILYKKIWSLYLIANAIWILLIYVPYTNRIAYLSWFIMPIVLTAPFVSEIRFTIKGNKQKLLYVMYGSLAFTILMELI